MHAHDPKRYVGDILAWLHQAIPVEKENLLTLVKACEKTGKDKAYLNFYEILKIGFNLEGQL